MYTRENKEIKEIKINDFLIELPYLPPHSKFYLILEIRFDRSFEDLDDKSLAEMIPGQSLIKKHRRNSSNHLHSANKLKFLIETTEFQADLVYIKGDKELKEVSITTLEYTFPLIFIKIRVHQFDNDFLVQAQVLNCSNSTLQVNSWELINCRVINDPNSNAILKAGQILHLAFIVRAVKSTGKICIKYRNAPRGHERKTHIDPDVDRKMKEQEFKLEHFFLLN